MGMHPYPGESPEYRRARDALLRRVGAGNSIVGADMPIHGRTAVPPTSRRWRPSASPTLSPCPCGQRLPRARSRGFEPATEARCRDFLTHDPATSKTVSYQHKQHDDTERG
jgi:hypothetical protein